MRFNLQIRNFQQKVLSIVNEEQLPLEVKRIVLSQILDAVSKAADEAVEREGLESAVEAAQEGDNK